jgi:hypothetical protein
MQIKYVGRSADQWVRVGRGWVTLVKDGPAVDVPAELGRELCESRPHMFVPADPAGPAAPKRDKKES